MKGPFLLTLIIVILAVLLGGLQEGRRAILDDEHRMLVERAVALGLSPDGTPAGKSHGSTSGSGGAVTSVAPTRATAKAFSEELIAFARIMAEWEQRGEQPPPEVQREAMLLFQRFLELDAEVIGFLIEDIRATSELNEKQKGDVIRLSFTAMAQASPQAALDFFVSSKDLIEDAGGMRHPLQMALGGWAAEDPEAALAWLDIHGKLMPLEASREARKTAVVAAFGSDPEWAIKAALTLDDKAMGEVGAQIARHVQSPGDQVKLLDALRGTLGGVPGADDKKARVTREAILRDGIVSGLAMSLGQRTGPEARAFLEEATLDADEQAHLAKRLANQSWTIKEPDEWLPWIHEHSDPAARDDNVKRVVSQWTRTDFRATAEWIGQQPDGPLKEDATWQFAHTVAPHEPESAAAWAVTLPASEDRTTLLKHIHTNWTGKDEAAAAEFAAKHGLGDR